MITDINGEDLIEKYNQPVPRYTSFPTAAQFQQIPSQEFYKQLLLGITEKDSVSLYIHIPFCHSLCHYCGCHTKVVNTSSSIRPYFQSLLQEISLVGKYLKGRPFVNRIHFGGGSPNYADSEDLESTIQELSKYFEISSETQIDMELDPRLLTLEKIQAYKHMGIKRASLGIQDFHPDVQKAINRIQPFSQVKQIVDALRSYGVLKINFDLITGLPLQTPKTIEKTLELAISLKPDRLAVFPYAHVPWLKKHQKLLERFNLPDPKARFLMQQQVRNYLQACGYQSIGIDHFAWEDDPLYTAKVEGSLRRNFQGYTDEQASITLGFGLSSISVFERAYIQNTTSFSEYREVLSQNQLPIARGCFLSEDDVKRRSLIETLMCQFEVDLGAYPGIKNSLIKTEKELMGLEEDKLIAMEGSYLKITERGRPFTRIIASCFDPYFQINKRQHAQAL